MFSTTEIRWFSKELSRPVLTWFNDHCYHFDQTEARTDYYLPIENRKGIGIKLREGNIEVKHRTGVPKSAEIVENLNGLMESYIKWSFNAAEDDPLSNQIIHENKYDWIALKKTRLGFILTEKDSEVTRMELDEIVDFGCQVEYTRVETEQETWYTFGLEWFGDQQLEIPPAFLKDLLGSEQFPTDSSMGYADFILKLEPSSNF
ncbi:hypothetical protein E0K83_06965 [Gramella sp. BOM4]|nr:hypothetical protein [Christiangramia bathymodioli]